MLATFVKKVKKGSAYKLVPLEGQVLSSDKKLSTDYNVSVSNKILWTDSTFKEGSVFYFYGSPTLVNPIGGRSYYKTGGCCYSIDSPSTPEDIRNLYESILHLTAAEDKTATKESEKTDPGTESTKEDTLLDKISKDSALKSPSSSKDGFYVSSEDWSILVRNIQKHINTMIIGPTGCGKTSVVKRICDTMGKKLYTFDMGTMMDPVSSLLGVHRLEKGASVFDYAKFTQVIKEPCVILLDELSRAPLSAMNVLFSCLDDRRNLNIEIALGSGEREIDVNPEVTFIATANVGAEYSGTNSMDRALVNRFFPLELGCIPTTEEEKVLKKRTGISGEDAKIIVKIANNIRSLCNKQEVSVSLSIRETLMVAGLVADGWSIGKAMEMIYLPLYEGTKSDGERSVIYKTISSY